MWSTRIGGPRSRFVSLSVHFLVADSRDDSSAAQAIRNGLRFGLRPERKIRPHFRIDIVTLPRHVACQSSMHPEPHSVLPIRSRTSTLNRHRRSTWAGVSWPNDDGIGASGGDNIDRTLARTRTTRSTRSVTSLCVLLSERLPVRRRASYSKRNERATPQRFIEARQP